MSDDNNVYLTRIQSTVLKGIAIFCIISHNFFHLFPPVTYQNEMTLNPANAFNFIHDFSWPEIINCLFSFLGFYGVYIFVLLSGYGITKAFMTADKKTVYFIAEHIFKIYKLLLISALVYCIIVPDISFRALGKVLSLTSNFSPQTLFIVCGPWWFFSLIIQLYLFFFFLYKFIEKDISNIIFIWFVYVIIAFYWVTFNGPTIDLYANAVGHIPEFSLGIFLALYEKQLSFLNTRKFNLMALLVSLVILVLAQIYFYAFVFSFFFSAVIFLSAYKLLPTQNQFWIFTGKISPYLFGFNGFLYRGFFIEHAVEAQSAIWQIACWLGWLIVNYAFAYTAYYFLKFKK